MCFNSIYNTFFAIMYYMFILAYVIYPSTGNQDTNALLDKGKREYAKVQYNKAINTFQNIIQLEPDHAEAYFYMGIILESQRSFSKSIEYFIQSIQYDIKNKQYKEIALWKIILYYHKFKQPIPIKEYAPILHKLISENKKLTKIMEEAELWSSPNIELANSLLRETNKLEEQVKAMDINPKQDTMNRNEILQAIAKNYHHIAGQDRIFHKLYWRAIDYYKILNMQDHIIQCYETLIHHNQDVIKAQYKLGVLYKRHGNYMQATNLLNTVIRSNPTILDKRIVFYANYNLIQAQISLGKYKIVQKNISNTLNKKVFKKIKTNKHNYLLKILYCISSFNMNSIKKTTSRNKASQKQCASYLASIKKQKNKKSMLTALFSLAHSKYLYSQSMASNKSKRTKLSQQALSLYKQSFFKTPLNSSIDNIQEEVQNQQPVMPSWLQYDIQQALTLFYNKLLNIDPAYLVNFTKLYSTSIDQHPLFVVSMAEGTFRMKRYTDSIEYFLKIPKRSYQQEVQLLQCYTLSDQPEKLQEEFIDYISMHEKATMNQLIKVIETNNILMEFRKTSAYTNLTDKL